MRVKTLTKPVTTPKLVPTPAQRVEMSPRKLGSPVRMTPSSPKKFTPSKNQTPLKAEGVIALVQTLSPGSTSKFVVAPVEDVNVGNSSVVGLSEDSTIAGTFEITTPSKQMEIIEKTPSTQRSVSKFEVYEAPVTPIAPKTPMAPINATLSTPPPRQSPSSPNINVLFPPTPALAAVSRLATESINADALRSSPLTVGTARTPQMEKIMGTPQMEKIMGTPQMEKIMGTPQMEKIMGTPQMEKIMGTPQMEKVLTTPQMVKVLATPRSPRSPRFSVASAGSPVVVDTEIVASPRLIRVDFFERPNLPNVTEQVFVDGEQVLVVEQPEGQFEVLEQPKGQFEVLEQPKGQFEVLEQPKGQLEVLEQPKSHELQDGQTKLAPTESNLEVMADGGGKAKVVLEEPAIAASQNVEIGNEIVVVEDAAVPSEKGGMVEKDLEDERQGVKKAKVVETPLFNEISENVDETLIQVPENLIEEPVVEELMEEMMEEKFVDEKLVEEPVVKEVMVEPTVTEITEEPIVTEMIEEVVEEERETVKDEEEKNVESEESKVSSASSTPRRSTRRTNAATPASAAQIESRSSARKITVKRTPAPRKQQEIPMDEEPTPRTSRRTPAKTPATRGKKTPTAAITDVEENQGRRSVRKAGTITTPAPDVAKKTTTTKKSTARKAAVAKVEESEADGASPSYHPRAARGKAKASELTNDPGADENADPADTNKEAPIRTRTPAKRKAEEILEEDEGRRRSTRARTPAKSD
jgi:hypothetical protein